MTKRYKEGTLALATYASLTWAGVSLLAWFPSGGFESAFGLALLLVGFLKGLLRAGEEVAEYAGAVVLGTNALYLAARLPGEKGTLALAIVSFFFAGLLFGRVLGARRVEGEGSKVKK